MGDFPDHGYDQHRARCAACSTAECPRAMQLRRRRDRRREAVRSDARRAAQRTVGFVDAIEAVGPKEPSV